MNTSNITDSPDAPLAVRSSDLLAGESVTHKPLLDRIAHERDLCRNEGANDIAELLDEAGKVINDLWDENIGYGYAIQTLRRKCGISNDSTDCQEIWELIDALQNDRDRQISVTLGQMQTIRELREQYKRLHTQVSGYLSGKEWEHWQEYNNPKYAPKEPANVKSSHSQVEEK